MKKFAVLLAVVISIALVLPIGKVDASQYCQNIRNALKGYFQRQAVDERKIGFYQNAINRDRRNFQKGRISQRALNRAIRRNNDRIKECRRDIYRSYKQMKALKKSFDKECR